MSRVKASDPGRALRRHRRAGCGAGRGHPAGRQPARLRTGDPGWTSSVFVGGQGFNPDRARLPDPGFRLPGDPSGRGHPPPRVGPPVDPASTAQAGAYVGYRRDSWTLSSGVRQGLGAGAGGTRLDLGASYGFNVTPRHLITLSGGLTLGASTPPALVLRRLRDRRFLALRPIAPASPVRACGSPGATASIAAPPTSPRRWDTTARTENRGPAGPRPQHDHVRHHLRLPLVAGREDRRYGDPRPSRATSSSSGHRGR